MILLHDPHHQLHADVDVVLLLVVLDVVDDDDDGHRRLMGIKMYNVNMMTDLAISVIFFLGFSYQPVNT